MIIDRVGRKKLVYYGVSGMVVSLLLIGVYFLFGDSWGVSSLFLLVFFLFYVFCCAVSICAVVFVLLSEMYPTKVRGLAMSIAGFALWIGTYLIGQLITICSTGEKTSFEIDGYKKECLLNGYDDVDYLLSIQDDIARFEKARA